MTLPEPVIIGDATIYCCECEDALPLLGDDLSIVMDPPYLMDTAGGGKFRKARPAMDEIAAEDLDKGFDVSLITAKQMATVTCFCHNDQLDILLPHLKAEYGRAAVVMEWLKSNASPMANKHYQADQEFYVHVWRDGYHPQGTLAEKRRHWNGKNGRQDEYDHNTVKPIDLMKRIVANTKGDTIVDLFMGTGTTGAAALMKGRKFIGIEKRRKYFDMSIHRLRRVYADGLARLPSGNPLSPMSAFQ